MFLYHIPKVLVLQGGFYFLIVSIIPNIIMYVICISHTYRIKYLKAVKVHIDGLPCG